MEIKVPDIGDFTDVPVVAVLVAVGDSVAEEDPLIEIESDKATMEVPSPAAGVVKEIKVAEGDKVSEGSLIMVLEASGGGASEGGIEPPADAAAEAAPAPVAATGTATGAGDVHAEVVVLGSGPGGYTAAFRAADLGKKVVLIEKNPTLGGVCLNVGCIPSKALLHVAKVITEAEEMSSHGVSFAKPEINLDELRAFKDSVVGQLTGGLDGLSKGRKVQIVRGMGTFTGPNMISVAGEDGVTTVSFDQCIIAAGSEPVALPFIPEDERVIDSTGALELKDVPERMLVLGGGIIGLEMACVYDALGSKITVVELMDQIIPGADKDVVKPLMNRIKGRYENIFLKNKVTAVEATDAGMKVTFEDDKGESFSDTFDKVLVAVGRKPNGKLINADQAGVAVDDRGFIAVDKQQRTGQPHIFAIGDVVGQPMLAHKAVHEGKVAAEVAAGHKRFFDAKLIPSVAYTDPEVAWCGLTETEAKAKGIKVEKGVFPWAASGKSLSNGRSEGMTKLIFDPSDDRLLGACIVGTNAGDLISECALAIEMGADAVDLGHTIHPHPTLSETVNFAAEMFEGTITDLMPPKKRKK
ncbi:Dihydrolipoyl dehydrogenase [Pelagimonas phthalicica]|uniref:Dihydrolipoyl dehydrogenase n=1 Tax=Pelagimonas phthalicica TaxID=1037362 RepID=A0A238J8U9_9RHOB|nr:dihydrolipoyl dehydrogenase [Pelagimonas phthalicica]TDS94817.1 dihydrolipoamide dehydrogenase [Pelagimonas phthalicica]SMX26654.1 Dihydrolipoyl dehydrogenase [Pelagimonas phthalicica]